MKNLKLTKKLIALALALVLVFALVGNAMAGSIFGTIKNGFKTVWNGIKTAGTAVYDTGVYVFTDDDAATAYSSTMKAAGKTSEAARDTANSAAQIKDDACDVFMGVCKICEGAAELAVNGDVKSAYNYLMGDGPVDEQTRKAMERMAEGYKQADNGLVLDAISLIPGYGTFLSSGLDAVKTDAELTVGYITEEEANAHYKDDAINAAFGIVSAGMGTVVDSTGGTIVKTAVVTGAKETVKSATK